jgi:DNA polymerase-3 subunit alpha
MTEYYQFKDCGCKFEILNENPLRLKFEADIEKLPLDCKETWNLISNKSCKGIFQLDSHFAEHIVHEFKAQNIQELALCVAANRPGCLDAFTEDNKTITQSILDRRNKKEEIKVIEPIREFLKDSYGHMVYQEQMMFIAAKLAGFDPGTVNALRKAAAKKKPELMAKLRKQFIDGCKNVGLVNEDEANKIFDNIEATQRYSFNKSITKDTNIELENGNIITITNINIGDIIKTPEGNSKVLNKYNHGKQKIYEITLENGNKIKCTIFHKFLCNDGKIRTLYEILENGYEIICEE